MTPVAHMTRRPNVMIDKSLGMMTFKECSNKPDHMQTIKEDLGHPIIREQRAIVDRQVNTPALQAWMRAAQEGI